METKPKRCGIVPKFFLLKTDCFNLVQNLLSWAKYKGSLSVRQIRERTQLLFTSSLLDIGTFVKRLWNVCGTFMEHLWNICSFTVLTLLLPALFFSVAVLYTCSQGVKYCICTFFMPTFQPKLCLFFCKFFELSLNV